MWPTWWRCRDPAAIISALLCCTSFNYFFITLCNHRHTDTHTRIHTHSHTREDQWICVWLHAHTAHPTFPFGSLPPFPESCFAIATPGCQRAYTHTHTAFFILHFWARFYGWFLWLPTPSTSPPPPLKEFWPVFKNPKSTTGCCCGTVGPLALCLSPHMLTSGGG